MNGSALVALVLALGQSPSPDAVGWLLREQIRAADDSAPAPGTLAAALRRFYEGRDWRPAWTADRAAALVGAVEAAAADGLRPTDYPLDSIYLLLARPAPDAADLAALDLLLSSTFLLYGEHLSAGRFTPASADTMWTGVDHGLDLAAALGVAVDRDRVAATLRRLAPPHAGYVRLRRALARYRADTARVRQIEANLERWRWLPRDLGRRHIIVDVPAFSLAAVDSGRVVHRARAVVGRKDWPTPITSARITAVVFRPAWHVPRAIALAELVPAERRAPGFLKREQIRVFSGARELDARQVDWSQVTESTYAYRLVQDPGPENPLGGVRFLVASPFAVMLHDTPGTAQFARRYRAGSHGCIRVEGAAELAGWLLPDTSQWTPDSIAAAMRPGAPPERQVRLSRPVRVVFAYWTAWVDEDGVTSFRYDLYGWDAVYNAIVSPSSAARTLQAYRSRIASASP